MRNLLLLSLCLLMSGASFSQKVTYSGDVASIIYSNCTSCHREGSIAPFTLESYQDVYKNRYSISSAIQNKIMPPWSPDPAYSHFLNERMLSKTDITKIIKWVNNGAERGDSTKEPQKPVFNDLTQLKNADLSKRITPHTVKKKLDEFKFFSISSDLTQDAFIKQIELLPANRKVVHHIFLFIDSTGSFNKLLENDSDVNLNGNNYLSGGNLNSLKLIGGWLPGGSYYSVPDSFCFRVPKHSYYIVQIHYAPGSYGQSDSTQLNIKYTSGTGLTDMKMKPLLDNVVNISSTLYIPADSIKTFQENMYVDAPMQLISVTPHMHKIGKRMLVYAYNPTTGDTIHLIDDSWNFHWQGMYTFPKRIAIDKGYYLHAEGTYNNTKSNTDNPNNPPQDIIAGTSTLTEMMQVFFCFTGASPKTVTSGIAPDNTAAVSCIVSPNPIGSGKELSLEINKQGLYTVALYSMDGRKIQSYEYINGSTHESLTLPGVSPGVYVLKIYNAQNVLAKKILVE